MASIAHLAAGAVCGAVYARSASTEPAHAIAAGALLAVSPDLDFFAASFGAAGTPLEHRVMTHSLSFALLLGMALGLVFGARGHKVAGAVTGIVALASHGIMDALTTSTPGPQLLWPFVGAPIQFGWQPIPGTSSFQDYFTTAGLPVLSAEAVLCVPLLALTTWLVLSGGGIDRALGRRRTEPSSRNSGTS
jgi:inner membrane protein